MFSGQIWNHPDVLYEALEKENQANEQDLDLDDITSASNPRCPAPSASLKTKVADSSKGNNSLPPLNPSQDRANQVITYEWVGQGQARHLDAAKEMQIQRKSRQLSALNSSLGKRHHVKLPDGSFRKLS